MSKENKTENDLLFQTIFVSKPTKGEKKRLAIVEKAIDMFQVHGVTKVSFDRIAKAMGTNRSHITYYFKTHEDLIECAIRYMMSLGHEYTFECMKKESDDLARLEKYLEGYYGFFAKNGRFVPLMMYFFYLSSIYETFSDLQIQVRQGAFSRIRELFLNIYIREQKKVPAEIDSLVQRSQSLILSGLVYALTTKSASLEVELMSTKRRVYQDLLFLIHKN